MYNTENFGTFLYICAHAHTHISEVILKILWNLSNMCNANVVQILLLSIKISVLWEIAVYMPMRLHQCKGDGSNWISEAVIYFSMVKFSGNIFLCICMFKGVLRSFLCHASELLVCI